MKDKPIKEVVPEDKMRRYLEYFKGRKTSILCDCGKTVEVEMTPYFYDRTENDVYLASICPECGDLIITKE